MKRKHNERKLIRLVLGALLTGSLLYAPDMAMAGVTTTVTDDNINNNDTVYGNNNGTVTSRDTSKLTDNHLTVNTSQDSITNVYGAWTNNNSAVTGNTVEILSGNFSEGAYGGYYDSYSGSGPSIFSNNKLYIKGGNFTGTGAYYNKNIYVVHEQSSNPSPVISNNELVISDCTIADDYYIGLSANKGTVKDNTISILVPLTAKWIVCGNGTDVTHSNNTLNIGASGVTTKNTQHLGDFDNFNFYLTANVKANDKMLIVNDSGATNLEGKNIGVAVVKGSKLVKGDTVDLIYNEHGVNGNFNTTELTTDKTATGLTVDTSYKMEIKRKDVNTVMTEVIDIQEEEVNPERVADLKSLVETRASTATYINAGSDLLATQGFSQAAEAVAQDLASQSKNTTAGAAPVSMFTPFFSVGGSSLRAESGSYVETKGFGLNLGFAREIKNSQGKLLFGPIVEYGGGNYDSYLDNGTHGEGGAHYFGIGIMARQVNHDGFYYEGSLRGGRVNSDYKSNINGIGNVNYDSSSNYWAAHLGLGKVFDIGHNNTLDGYMKYFFSHQGGDTATIHAQGLDDSVGVFDAVNSHRIRIGARLTHKVNETNRIYGGLAYQYEFGGDARAHFDGNGVPSPSIKGSSGMLELGWKVKPDNGPMTLDLGITGWVGKQRGGTVQLGATWTF